LTNNRHFRSGRPDVKNGPAGVLSGPRWQTLLRFPGILGTLAFVFYLAWNIRWLAAGVVPPSILLGVFGIPAPTTGMTRSTLAMLDGNWDTAILWNPFTLPFCLVLAWTVIEVFANLLRRQRLVLSKPLTVAWPAMLLAAWIAKFAIGPQWW
jgi:hypothetical protein